MSRHTAFIFLALLLSHGIYADSTTSCNELALALGDKVAYPDTPAYANAISNFYDEQQRDLSPACIVLAQSTADVSEAVKTLTKDPSQLFAVRSGGHGIAPALSNIEAGVTIDVSAMKQVVASDDRSIASISPGNRWRDVYAVLDPLNITVAGGRAASVGVGGFLTGGGLSFMGARVGFGCDTIQNFEVVLASGEIVNANNTSNTDLYRGLKGGSNNFGIVTRFDMTAIPSAGNWANVSTYNITADNLDSFADNFYDFAVQEPYDEFTGFTRILVANNGYIDFEYRVYTKEFDARSTPAPYQNMSTLSPLLQSTQGFYNVSENVKLLGGTDNSNRTSYRTATYKMNQEHISKLIHFWYNATQQIMSNPDLRISISFQPLPVALTSKAEMNGGNSLGISGYDVPHYVMLLSCDWVSKDDDDFINGIAKSIFDYGNQLGDELGVSEPYIFLNYGANDQPVIQGYGQKNVDKLLDVSRKYDPTGVFQKQVPGGFKLPGLSNKYIS